MTQTQQTKKDLIEKYFDTGNTLRVGEAFDIEIGTTELRSIVSRLNKEYQAYEGSFRIKAFPIKGKRYSEYRRVRVAKDW